VAMWAARLGVCYCAGLEVADSNYLASGPNLDGEGAGSTTQYSVGAIIEGLQHWDDAATTDPDEGGGERLGWQLVGQQGAVIVPGQRKEVENHLI
jgi:hypothetical protein